MKHSTTKFKTNEAIKFEPTKNAVEIEQIYVNTK